MDKQQLTYTEAITRLETIVNKIDNGQMDVDSLAANLKEAKQLVAFCRQKLQQVDEEVKHILSDETAD
ncbi:MAG: exodeoxyribonuclease VII small subunit [Prevotellaceae bacterium]|nr:exodeoxyribonuclease VII small subunit [Prevotellaceae bacterium]